MENDSTYRIAICISGQLRSYKSCIENSKRYFETINIPNKKIQIDYFFHTWDINTWSMSDAERNTGEFNTHDTYSDIDIQYIKSTINVIDYKIESYYGYRQYSDISNIWSGLFYSMKSCNDLKSKHEMNNKFTYDLVIKTRFDIIHPLDSVFPVHDLEENTAYAAWEIEVFPNEYNLLHFQDVIFYGNSKTIDSVCNIYEKYYVPLFNKYSIAQNGVPKENILGPGTMLHLYFKQEGIIPKFLHHIPYYISRYDTYVNKLDGIIDIDEVKKNASDYFDVKTAYNNPPLNVAYSNILCVDSNNQISVVGSNISNYDIHPSYIPYDGIYELQSKYNLSYPIKLDEYSDSTFCDVFGRMNMEFFSHHFNISTNRIFNYKLDDVIDKDIPFIYPILICGNDLMHKYDTVDIDERVIKLAHIGKSKIVFIQPNEGIFGDNPIRHYKWFNALSSRYNLSPTSLIIISANLRAPETFHELCEKKLIVNNFTILPYNYFRENVWFLDNMKISNSNEYLPFLKSNRTRRKKKHFLCFNRVQKNHRLLMFYELRTNPKFHDKYITSLGPSDFPREMGDLLNFVGDSELRLKMFEFYRNYDFSVPYVYDEPDLENNKADVLNTQAHMDTFINVVTESLTCENSIFFSEKIYKPIYMLQPFILFGNPNSLRKLKELGFKTFDMWWDESYDSEIDMIQRFKKIVNVMEEISSWDYDKCFRITNEMEDVLIHNFKIMMDIHEGDKIINTLKLCKFDSVTRMI